MTASRGRNPATYQSRAINKLLQMNNDCWDTGYASACVRPLSISLRIAAFFSSIMIEYFPRFIATLCGSGRKDGAMTSMPAKSENTIHRDEMRGTNPRLQKGE
ncbi:hypothetical protein ISCGN_005273 [Ixodes scapularis]